ncbi:MAG TPA: hypothetical protein VH479_18095 [Acidimicrobiales bacterium]
MSGGTVSEQVGSRAVRARRLAAVLLAATAGLFVLGVSAEREEHRDAGSRSGEVGDAHGREGGEAVEGGERSGESGGESGEGAVLGVDLESPGIVALGVVVSVGLAAALWMTDRRAVAWAAAGFAAVFVLADLAEVGRQLDEAHGGLALLAVALALGHAAAAGAAAVAAVTPR